LVGSSQNSVLTLAFDCLVRAPNFSSIKVCIPELEWFLDWCDLLQLWNVAFCYRQYSHQKFGVLWIKDHGSMNEWKLWLCAIFVNILTPVCTCPVFLGHTTHYHVSWLEYFKKALHMYVPPSLIRTIRFSEHGFG